MSIKPTVDINRFTFYNMRYEALCLPQGEAAEGFLHDGEACLHLIDVPTVFIVA